MRKGTKYTSNVYQHMAAYNSTNFLTQNDFQRVPLETHGTEGFIMISPELCSTGIIIAVKGKVDRQMRGGERSLT